MGDLVATGGSPCGGVTAAFVASRWKGLRHKSSIRKMNEFYGINAHLSSSGRAGDASLERLLARTEGGYGGRVSLDSLVGGKHGW